MKTVFLKISAFVMLFALMEIGCTKDITESILSNDVKTLVFEAKYGNSTEIDVDGEKYTILVQDIKDDVTVDCSLVDFQNNNTGAQEIRIYSYLQVNDQKDLLSVESKPCGALEYKNNGDDILEIKNMINDLKSAPANLEYSSYFNDAFVNLFGEGTTIKNTTLRIYIAKAFPNYYGRKVASKDDYKFLFIITKK